MKQRILGTSVTKRIERLEENVGAADITLDYKQLTEIRDAADQITIVGERYPEENDRMTNLEAPLPTTR